MGDSQFIQAQIALAVVTIIGATGNIFYGIRMSGTRYWKQKYEEAQDAIRQIKQNKDIYKQNYKALLNDYNRLLGEHETCEHFDKHKYRSHKPLA